MLNPVKPEDRQLKQRLWLLKRKPLIYLIIKILLLILIFLPWLIFVIYLINFLSHYSQDRQIISELLQTTIISQEVSQPQSLVVVQAKALTADINTYDLFAAVTNPNPNFAAVAVTYYFTVGSAQTESQTTFFLPGEEKFLTSLNYRFPGDQAPAVSLVVEQIKWQRLTHPEKLPNVDFEFVDLKYSLVDLAQGAEVGSQITGFLVNHSAYGFKNVQVAVALYWQNQPVAVASTYLDQILSGQSIPLNFIWSHRYPFQSEIKTRATVNNLTADSLILP